MDHFPFKTLEQMESMIENPKQNKKINDKLADIFFSVLHFAECISIDLTQGLYNKMKKNAKNTPLGSIKDRI